MQFWPQMLIIFHILNQFSTLNVGFTSSAFQQVLQRSATDLSI